MEAIFDLASKKFFSSSQKLSRGIFGDPLSIIGFDWLSLYKFTSEESGNSGKSISLGDSRSGEVCILEVLWSK